MNPETMPDDKAVHPDRKAYQFAINRKPGSKPVILEAESGSGVISGIHNAMLKQHIHTELILHHDMPRLEEAVKNAPRPCAVLFDAIDRSDTGKALAFMRAHAKDQGLMLYATWNPKPGVWDSLKEDKAFQIVCLDKN